MCVRWFGPALLTVAALLAAPAMATTRVHGLAPSPVFRPGGVTGPRQPPPVRPRPVRPHRRGFGPPIIFVPYTPAIRRDVVADPITADFERLDRNGNNRISLLESHAQAGLHSLLPKFDANGDGSLDLSEYRALRAAEK